MSNNQESVTMTNTEKREKMKKELEKVGMYQPNVPLDYMKQVFDAIQESKEMANIPINNAGNQKDMLHSINNLTNKPDITIKGDSISETDNNRAKPSCSYNTYCNNSSSESPKPRNKRNIANKKKTTDDNDGNDNGADKNLSRQKSKNNTLQESCNLRVEKKMSSLQKDFLYQTKRWKINPLDSQCNQKDVALQQPKRPPIQERLPFRLCKGTHTEEESVKILNDLNIHLKNMANLWLNCHDNTTESMFQWGTPIQVDTDNNSLGRIPSMVDCYYDEDDIDMISNYDEGENVINNCNDDEDNLPSNYVRESKRKASWFANTKISNSSSDDETTLSFIKKHKSDDTSKMYKTLHKKELSTEEKYCTKEDLDKEDLFSNNNLINEKDDKDSKSINVKHLQGPNERTVSPEILSNPRRDIVSKSSLLDINKTQVSYLTLRNSKKGSNQCDLEVSPSTSRKESLSNIQTNKELIGQLDKINKNINEASITKDIVVKPLPMKNFSTRLAKQCAKLKQTDAERKKKILSDEKEAVRKTLEEKDKKKQDYVKRRMQEMEEMSKEKLKVLNKEKKKDRLMEVLEGKSTSRTPKWKKLMKKQKKDTEIDEDDIDKIIEEIENDDYIYKTQVTCPICNKSFANDKIENHAAMCDQFQTEDEFKQDYVYSAQSSRKCIVKKDKVKNSQARYECNICSSFQTDSGIDYEDHVNKCLQNRHNSPPRGTPILIDVPDSPINSFQSISEQKNSNIDYTDQLTNTTKKAQIGRKRKR
ncbi:PREDICTED: serine/threonine-protein kinase pakD-like [Polistes canadensis]|uniref:serine/threonine-protein kinase pakD-like n=1 Tax=Polistes canadensis TaxID=91411 RepID=UPI000718C0D4|nr:PREDICTED: serine/threonine-protein kinase pakD-like [Polistes canadensis]